MKSITNMRILVGKRYSYTTALTTRLGRHTYVILLGANRRRKLVIKTPNQFQTFTVMRHQFKNDFFTQLEYKI